MLLTNCNAHRLQYLCGTCTAPTLCEASAHCAGYSVLVNRLGVRQRAVCREDATANAAVGETTVFTAEQSALTAEQLARITALLGLPWCWFDGEASAQGEARVSYFGVSAEVREAETGREHEFLSQLRDTTFESEPGPDNHHGFTAGWALALSYEFGVGLLGLTPAPDSAPPAFALKLPGLLALHHATGELRVHGAPHEKLLRAYEAAVASAENSAGVARSLANMTRPADSAALPVWRRSDAEYTEEVEACRRAIHDGEAYVLCLTDTAESTVAGSRDPLELYLRLRERGAATRGGIIAANGRALVSASPERFLSVASGRVTTHPIKGTRARDPRPEVDRALARELQSDPKERSENLMIVDLMRNDLSRVCEAGTVRVDRFLQVESHPHVHQLVSTVSGELSEAHDVFDALEACFPGGSMTGAPKRRAVELLAGIEAGPRGLYSGCFGWIDQRGDAEIAMTIRSVELRESVLRTDAGIVPATELRVGAGGGITADSQPEAETAEKHLKAASLLAHLG